MIITAREYTSADAAEIRANAAAIHARLMKPRPRPTLALTGPSVGEKRDIVTSAWSRRPLWMRQDIHFDTHVIESRRIVEMLRSGEIELVKIKTRTVAQIVAEVLESYPNISVAQLKGPGRCKGVVKARMEAVYAVRMERTDLSLPAIGRWFGGRDHSTIYHAVNKIAALRGAA